MSDKYTYGLKMFLKSAIKMRRYDFTGQCVELGPFWRTAALRFRECSLGNSSLNRNDRSICNQRQGQRLLPEMDSKKNIHIET